MKAKYAGEQVTDIDGVKIDFPAEWVHLRKSNTEPIIRIYSESRDKAAGQPMHSPKRSSAKSVQSWPSNKPPVTNSTKASLPSRRSLRFNQNN